jgi:hypothetical protein
MEDFNAVTITELSIAGLGVVAVTVLYLLVRRLQRDLIVVPAEERIPLLHKLNNALWFLVGVVVCVDVAIIVMELVGPERINDDVYVLLFIAQLAVLAIGVGHCIGVMRQVVHVFRQYDPESQDFIKRTSDTGTS